MATVVGEQPVSVTTPTEQDKFHEVVDGQQVDVSPMGTIESQVASFLLIHLGQFALQNRIGQAVVEMLFVIDSASNLKRRPDVAFVSYQRWPRGRRGEPRDGWDVVPDLAVEVVSAGNTADEILGKLDEYFRAGVRLAWVIYPNYRKVYVYESPTSVRVLQPGDELDGGEVVPGFRLPLAALFEG